jgi:uncharacterized repeat protein (TIGR03833 family)
MKDITRESWMIDHSTVSIRQYAGQNNRKTFICLACEVIMNGDCRDRIRPGLKVAIVLKKDQRTGALTEGIVKRILTKSSTHPHGIKVELETGEVGRVKTIIA